jgi:hypothetical protein
MQPITINYHKYPFLATGLQAGQSALRITTGITNLCVPQNAQTNSGSNPHSYSVGSFPDVQRLGHEVYCSPTSSAKFQSQRSCTSTSPLTIRSRSVDYRSLPWIWLLAGLTSQCTTAEILEAKQVSRPANNTVTH